MAKSSLAPRRHKEWWCLLLIPFCLLLLDSYGWLPQAPQPTWAHKAATVYRVKADQPQALSIVLPQALGTLPAQTRLEHSSGDVHLLVTETKSKSVDIQVPALPAGHYTLRVTQGETQLLQEKLHVLPNPKLAIDRYFVQAGDTLSLWRNTPAAATYTLEGMTEGTLSSQNPHPISLPEDLPSGKYLLQVAGVGSLSFEVLQKPTQGVTVKPHHDLVLPGVAQPLYLHVLDAQQQPLRQGWVRINEQSYPVNNGLAIAALPAQSIQSELLFTAGIAEGQIEQGTLQLQLATAPWAISVVPAQPNAREAQHLQWVGSHRAALSWQAQQDHQSLSGKLPTEAPLSALYEKLHAYFNSDSPVSLRFVDAQGRGQSMSVQFPPRETQFTIQPARPHALSTITAKSPATLTPWINHYRPGAYGWSDARPRFNDEALEAPPQYGAFLWLLAGLICSSLLWGRARQRTQHWRANLEQSQRLKRARNGILLGAGIWLLSLPAAWLGDTFLMTQSYLLGLTISSLSLIWAMRKVPLLQPVWIFTQTALLLLCFWFNLTYWPAGQHFVILWSGLLTLGWLSLFELWQRRKTPSNSRLVLAAALAALSIIQGIVSLQGAQALLQSPNPSRAKHTISYSHYPVVLPQLAHSQLSPASFSLTGQGGVHLLSSMDPQGLSYVQTLNVMETPRVETQAPAIAQRNDLLQLPVRLSNATPGMATLPLRLQGPGVNLSRTERLKAGESQTVYLPIRYRNTGINTYTLSQFYDGQWHAQQWQTYVNPDSTAPAQNTDEIKFSPLRLQITYPEPNAQVGGEIPVVVDFQHRLPEDTALQLSIGIPAGFSAITDTLTADKTKGWLADFRPSTSSLNIDTTVLRAGQRVRFHYRLKAAYAGEFQTPEAVLSSKKTTLQREFAQATLLKVLP